MSKLTTILKHLCILVLPVFMFDAFANREPFYELDARFTIGMDGGGSWFLQRSGLALDEYKSVGDQIADRWSLDDITDYGVTDEAIIGKAPEGDPHSMFFDRAKAKLHFFIVDRKTGKQRFFDDEASRNQVLQSDYHRERRDFCFDPSLLTQMKNNLLWPYVHLYYGLCLVLIVGFAFRRPIVTPALAT
jgi:hypothetical protein